MAITGRKPNDGPVRHRVTPRHDWIEVENKTFRGARHLPALQPDGQPWPDATREWWRVISHMPHCVLWDDADWRFALDTALVATAFHSGDMRQAVELRQREKIMGTTLDARRDLRIRYVEVAAEEERPGIRAIEDYRKALQGDRMAR